jgi:hypothetical protein
VTRLLQRLKQRLPRIVLEPQEWDLLGLMLTALMVSLLAWVFLPLPRGGF